MTKETNKLSSVEKEIIHILFTSDPIDYDALVRETRRFGQYTRGEIESGCDTLQEKNIIRVVETHHPYLVDWNHDQIYNLTKQIYREWVVEDKQEYIDNVDLDYFNYDLQNDDELRKQVFANNI